MYSLHGKVALITGGSMGIGADVAKQFLQANLKGVSIVDINEKAGLETIEALNSKYGKNKAIFIKADVACRHQLDEAFKKTIYYFKNLDIVVNSAGIVLETQWEKEIAVNLTGTVNSTILAFENYLSKYKSGDEGVIVNISSMAGLYVNPAIPIYSATKSGVIGLTRTLGYRRNYERTKIKVLAICPGPTDTTIFNINDDTLLGPYYFKAFDKFLTITTSQPVTAVSEAILKIVNEGISGSVWVVHKNEAYEVKFMYELIPKL